MAISDKILKAKNADWIGEGISEAELKTIVELAKISAQIESSRLNLNMNQTEFAKYMGVTQGMISKWESRDYNFTIRSLNEICHKLQLNLSVNIEQLSRKEEYVIVKWDEEIKRLNNKKRWAHNVGVKEAIA